ncbi:CBS domain-containing protein (plasmid) [Rhizobium sp. CB3090]|uniref:CBS domain-containing protein n=1 Tax=Rhizobium sp. CB3090 TaxID=3039156 RepID=UPI0024B1C039|nr:CBS domain-containing protein [Rhizobium sp. CB3090]WFU11347.1 CBS domain-containing protein [Rhizobium sp. CB3090]
MKVRDAMTHDVRITNPDETILQAAQTMADLDAGILPVGDHDRLVGMITDRDIAIRGIAKGRGPDAKVRDVMTSEVKYCFDDQEIDEVCRNMGSIKVRRLPVLDHSKRLVGILSLGDIALAQSNGGAGQALSSISRHGGDHSQTA